MRLEPATTSDIDELHALIERAYRGDTARAGWSHEADLLTGARTSARELAEFISEPARHLLVLRREDRIRACVLLWQRTPDLVYLGMLTVDPKLQGQGLGKDLLAEAERHAQAALGARKMEMQVFTLRRELLSFYERRGYRSTGERRPFPYAAWPMAGALRDDLEFEVLEKQLLV